jgi:two-component system CheB/CheR fusion protein
MATDKVKNIPPASEQNFPIVGIGASAGGLDAFKRFLQAITPDSGMAYVLVQHLSPTHESILPEILSRVTKIPVDEIKDDIHLAPNHIYVIPENKSLTAEDGVLKLSSREDLKTHHTIDVFFSSLAEVHKSLAVGVVLSGTGSDGTAGLRAIKQQGGFTFAQTQESASSGNMPQNAVNAEVVDFILAPEEIPAKLLQIMKTYQRTAPSEEFLSNDEEPAFKQIIELLFQRSKVDFTYYKQTTIRRRIARRMALCQKEKLTDYVPVLQGDVAEQDALFQDFLISVTSFFRDPKIFQSLSESVFPALYKARQPSQPIRIWVAGCSSGEESYSIAIALQEFSEHHSTGTQVQIFASDISESAITKARQGIYDKSELGSIPEDLLKKYFTKTPNGYQVNRQIRDMCVFAVHNFLKDPSFSKMDLITCRNVLIYMDTFLQKKALTTFHYALKDTGFLMLGKSETSGPASELFSPFAKNDKIYSRKSVPVRYMHVASARKEDLAIEKEKKNAKTEAGLTDFKKSAEAILLSKYTPASVIINEQMDIVHIQGVIAPFLEPSQGKPTFNLLKMAREGLAFELRNAIHKAKTSNATVVKEGVFIEHRGTQSLVNLEVMPLTNIVEPHFLIVFHKPLLIEKGKISLSGGSHVDTKQAVERITQLENELAQTREDMRAITEDQEAVNEELQSANEELLSNNEEMQSLNEEMETSKEELQSTNEELTIVNQELFDKQEQISISRQYAEAIIATVREPFVVLDKLLCIKSINTAFYKQFNLTEAESQGKPIYEIKNGMFENAKLRALLEKVLPERTALIDYEIIVPIPAFGECTMLLNAGHIINEKNKEQLILLSIQDITQRKIAQVATQSFSEGLELKVKERTAALEQSNTQLEQFAHSASHELQEPLRKIVTFSKVLTRNFETGDTALVKEYLSKIEVSSVRMTQLIQHLLDFASVGYQKILHEKTDLDRVFQNILADFELIISEKEVTLTSDHLPEIEAVPFQIHQLFYDLVGNALKFTKPDTKPVIHIHSHLLNREEIKQYPKLNSKLRYYELIFEDNGIGFDQKYALQIFTMFQRLNTEEQYPGTGIGLALCKKIVANYSGEIFARSQKGAGAAFHVILPVQQPDSGPVETKPF